MYTNLVLYRNELKNKSVARYKIIGIVTELLYSKEIFRKNQDIAIFTKEVFGIEFKDYIMKSRTMIVARIGKEILYTEDDRKYKEKLIKFINTEIENIKNSTDIKEKKNDFDGWIK